MSVLAMDDNDIQKIDSQIEPMMDWAIKRKAEAEQLSLDAARLMACTSERFNSLKKQGFFKRCWNKFSGKNDDIANANINDLIHMQRIAFRYVNMLQERELLMGHALLSLKNNLISLAVKDAETRELVGLLAKRTALRFENLESRVDQLEITTNLQGWLLGLEEREYDEKYPTQYMRLFKVINDFYGLKNDNWNYNDIMFLKKAIRTVGINPKQKVSMREFIEKLTEEIQTNDVGFESYVQAISRFSPKIDNYSKFVIDNISSPVYVGMHALKTQFMDRMDIVETLEEEMNISKNEALNLLLNKAISNLNVNIQYELCIHDIAIEILTGLRLSNLLIDNAQNQYTSEPYVNPRECNSDYTIEKEIDSKIQVETDSNIEVQDNESFKLGEYKYDLVNEEVGNWEVTQLKPKGCETPEEIITIISFNDKFYILTEYVIYETEDFIIFKSSFDSRILKDKYSFDSNDKLIIFKNKLLATCGSRIFLYTDDGKEWSTVNLPDNFTNFRDIFKFKDYIIFLGTKYTRYSYTVSGLIWDSRKETSCAKPIILYGTNLFDLDVNNISNDWERYEYRWDSYHLEIDDKIYFKLKDCVNGDKIYISSADCNTWIESNIPNNFIIDKEYINKVTKFFTWSNYLKGFNKLAGEKISNEELTDICEEMKKSIEDNLSGPDDLSGFLEVYVNSFSKNSKIIVFYNKDINDNKIFFAPIIKK